MTAFLYNDLVRKIALSFDEALAKIQVEYSFDFGTEFEVAICKTLRQILPPKFGICRGFVINRSGEQAGDDVIIYEQTRFPTFRQLGDDYSRKEKIPIEAVFAYIEAKHTLQLVGDGDSSLLKALRQAARVKALCDQRDPVPLNQVAPHVNLEATFNISSPPGWPSKRNPVYTAILSRQVRIEQSGPVIEDPAQIYTTLVGWSGDVEQPTDLIVAGRSNISIPVVELSDGQLSVMSPFCLDSSNKLISKIVDGFAFGVALTHLLWALDNIELGLMHCNTFAKIWHMKWAYRVQW